MKYHLPQGIHGLTDDEVKISRNKYGSNLPIQNKNDGWWNLLFDILKEPMLLILIAVAIIYIIVGNYSEAIFMFFAIIAVSGISFYQDNRSRNALKALEKLNEPLSTVIRNSEIKNIPTTELVVGDYCYVDEGKMVNADGKIVYSSDFSINESSLTGESFSVYKNNEEGNNNIYSGTLVLSGFAVFIIENIGGNTKIGKIGHALQNIKEEQSPLHNQIIRFVKGMAIIGILIFFIICIFSYWTSGNIIFSLLTGLTLAMSILPEEIPVAFTTFMALGARKLMKEGIIIKKSTVVETLGSTTVICTDKTGTITENSMQLKALYDFKSKQTYYAEEFNSPKLSELISYSVWSSELIPFDPMEITLHKVYEKSQSKDLRTNYKMIHEYPLEGKPPMMTHILEDENKNSIIACKGAPEAILAVSNLSEEEKVTLRKLIKEFGQDGYRLLGVGKAKDKGNEFPKLQQEIPFEFLGFIIFYDPPKQGIQKVFNQVYNAGIKVKVITGDNAETSKAIAKQAGIINASSAVDGKDLINLDDHQLADQAKNATLFTRMFPEAKLRLVNSLKNEGEVVAMLGDGVNDAPALRAAHIGVAMGNKGTEIAKSAASLVIVDDQLDKLVVGIAEGRRIYTNIKKAVQYIISIHIPIILTVSIPLFLSWVYPNIFTPVHVIFLELIMGPTCSIVYENEPMEKNMMLQSPRKMTDTFLNWRELSISIIQGLIITLGILYIYQFTVNRYGDENTTRAMVFTTLIFSNIFLCLVNRSFVYSVFYSMKNRNLLFPLMISMTLILLAIILYVPLVASLFQVNHLNLNQLTISLSTAAVSVLWFELYKLIKRKYVLK